jgi:hypothetical protein
MKRPLLAFMLMPAVLQAQAPAVSQGSELAVMLNFETEQTGKMPRGWGGRPPDLGS